MKHQSNSGFTLLELLVVIAVIGILAGVVLSSLNGARAKARDAKRKADIAQLRTAIEMYYSDYGAYPAAYPGYGVWGGTNVDICGSANGTTSGATAYIQGLVPTYIPVLPTDPKITGQCQGYLYRSDGADYALIVHATPEGAAGSLGDPTRDGGSNSCTVDGSGFWAWKISSPGGTCW